MGRYRGLAINVGLFTINAFATKLISFVLVPLYTYYMSAAEYGLTDMSLTVISLITPLLTLSVCEAAIRFIVGDKDHCAEYVAVSLGITLVSIPLVGLLTPLLDIPAFGGLGAYKGWFVLAYASSGMMNICGEIARGMGHIRLITASAVVSSLVTLVFAALLIGVENQGVIGYFFSVSAGPIIATVIYLVAGGIARDAVLGARRLLSWKREQVVELLRPMLSYSLPLIPNALFWWLSSSLNRLFITGMIGISASGMYAAASKVPNLLNTAYSVFQQAWQLSAFQESEESDIGSFFSKIFSIIQAGMTLLCSTLSLLSPWIASVLLQGETYEAWPMISILLLANLFNVLSTFYGTVYTTTMHTSFIMRTTLIGALSCIIFTPALIPAFGTYGACIAAALGQAFVFALRAVDSRKYLKFDIGWRFLVPTLILLVAQAALSALQPNSWQILSALCFVIIAVLQAKRLLPLLSIVRDKVRQRFRSRE